MPMTSSKECYSRKSRKGTRKQLSSTVKRNSDIEVTSKSHEKKKRRRRSLEAEHQKAAFTWLSYQYPAQRLVTFHPANGGSRNIIEAKSLKAQGVTPGVPDLVCLYPSRGYHGFACEFKHGNNDLTQLQSEFIRRLTENNYYCCVCYSWFEFRDHFKYYMAATDCIIK